METARMHGLDKVLFCGDTHADFSFLQGALGILRPSVCIVAGDFGYWRRSDFEEGAGEGFFHEGLRHPGTRIFFCDGNHENHALLRRLVETRGWEKPIHVAPGLFYAPRGSTAVIRGRRVLFAGGAFSIDRAYREEGRTWFAEEEMGQEELERILKRSDLDSVDAVVSHTCPAGCLDKVCGICGLKPEWISGRATEDALERIFQRLPRVRDWYFGHWHCAGSFVRRGVRFHLLNQTPGEGCLAGWGYRRETLEQAQAGAMGALQASGGPG
ncbi:metallophosphoesterase [Mesosutterella sp. AGMB02718]|uniref:Metallophosphoesterase n=1 Tax=Mesosutterella faecium TaxID=2925194 RepID=A0ABT7IRG9_9BURK|nr:metallophosphoesterase [Mesosutterella sp. AGMB02718]MDL2060498.1 metallophosphoesterase [Mesosutterella sp. AGMB02718]